MGNFNPNLPSILGMEFVPISQSLRSIDIGTEIGYGFTITGAPFDQVSSVQPIPFVPASSLAGQTMLYSFYPQGREDDTGEINVVRWTVATAFVTGAVVSGSSATACLTASADNSYIEFDSLNDRLRVTFNAPFALTGKRILGVELVYQAAGTPGFILEPAIESNTVRYPYGPYMTGPAALAQVSEMGRVRLGNVNPWWSTSAGPNTESGRMPWRYTDMLRWLTGAGGQLYFGIRLNNLPLSGFARLGYLAVDVYYCEESRVAYGGTAYGADPDGLLTFATLSTSPTIRDTTFTSPVTLTPGDYSITVTQADAGDKYNAGDKIALSQLYQYRGVSTHPTVEVEAFKKASGALPAIAPRADDPNYMVAAVPIHDANALQFGEAPVPYITVEGAPVYVDSVGNSITATQQIHNEAAAANQTYDQVRFYARRFNPLAVGDLNILPPGGPAVALTPEDFNELPELTIGENGDGTGWREVTLPIVAIFTNDQTFSNVQFSMNASTGEPIDQWQILTTRVFSYNTIDGKAQVSNTPAPLYQKSRYDGLQNATMTWKSPETVGATTTTDSSSTAVVMFSQDIPAPTGLAVSLTSMPVSGIGEDCGVPMCIPTSIYGNELTWSITTITGAFGYYELQRSDDIDDEFQTIGIFNNFATTEFTDWEARVGLESDYRIRSCNVSDFCGPWSSTVSFTQTAPGIGGAGDGNSVLIFTSNHGPTGNLAYIMQWEGDPVEEFAFPEAGFTELQLRYLKNFFTAHRPTERGGEQFSRTILVQAAAISAPSLANFRSLRDLAWNTLPYVCVRDELGNRWFANVIVPSGRVHRNRTAYLADITISEVTDEPEPVET